jgi:hypothetical protein
MINEGFGGEMEFLTFRSGKYHVKVKPNIDAGMT